MRSDFIEPALADDDWAGAVRAAAEGYGLAAAGDLDEGSGDGGGSDGEGSGGGFPWWLVAVPAGGVAVVALGLVLLILV